MKDVLWVVYLYPVRSLARILPVGFSRWIIRAAEPLFQLLHRTRRRRVEREICLATGLEEPAAWVRLAARRFVANAVVRAVDDLILDKLAASGGLRCDAIRGEEHLKKALESGKGVVVVSGHFYANRAAKRYLADRGYRLTSLRNNRPNDRLMGRLGQRYLQPRYIRFLHGVIRDEVYSRDPDVTLQLLRKLRAGGAVNSHIDVVSYREHLVLPFLGHRQGFATGMLEVIRLSGCTVIPMFCLGNSRNLAITFEEPIELDRADTRKEFAVANLPRLVSKMESQILAHPDQWEHWTRL